LIKNNNYNTLHGGSKREIESKFKNLMKKIPHSKRIISNLINSNFFKKTKKKFYTNILKDDNIVIKEIIKNYKKTKIKKKKKILMKQLKNINFKELKMLGIPENSRKTFNKYNSKKKNYKLEKEKKINEKNEKNEKKKKIFHDFMMKNTKETHECIKLNNKYINIRSFQISINNLYSKYVEEINLINKNKKFDEYFEKKICKNIFYKYINQSQIFKKAKYFTDYCKKCLYGKNKNLDLQSKIIFQEHLKLKKISDGYKYEKMNNLKTDEISIFLDFKQNFIIGGGGVEIEGKNYQSGDNFFKKSYITCFGIVLFYVENNEIKQKNYIYLSTYLSKTIFFVKQILTKFFNQLNNQLNFNKINIFSDCAFKNNENTFNLFNFELLKQKDIHIYYMLDGHGKSNCDSVFSNLSLFIKKYEKFDNISNIQNLFKILEKEFEKKNFNFFILSKEDLKEFHEFYERTRKFNY
jgi:hypothetical protein